MKKFNNQIKTKQKRITILAPDFKPMMGGVAEYTFSLAKYLSNFNLLDQIITPVPQFEDYGFKVSAPNQKVLSSLNSNKLFLKKLNSLSYLIQLRLVELRFIINFFVQRNQVLPILNWLISPLAERWIKIFHTFNIPYGLILHGKDIIVANKKNPAFFTKVCNYSSLLIFNSVATQNLFKQVLPEVNTSSYVLHPGIDIPVLDGYELFSAWELEAYLKVSIQEKIVISSVCRLVKRKGIDLAIKALEPLLKTNQNLVYIIAGNGEEYDSLAGLIERLEITKQVKLIGNIDDSAKYSLLDKSSIFLMPNHLASGEDFEGFGISFIEASYFGNVTIGGRNGGVVEAIKEGVNGFLVDTDSPSRIENLRMVIAELIANPEKIELIQKSAKVYVEERFQVRYIVRDFANHFSLNSCNYN